MATKEQMRAEIIGLEPANEIAKQKTVSHAELKAELTAVRRRHEQTKVMEAVEAYVLYRLEDGERLSWKIFRKDNDTELSGLLYGPELPRLGDMIEFDPEIPAEAFIKSVDVGLEISAGDLPVREMFDERRIYSTQNDTFVAFMREEHERIVLWSYKVQAEIMIGQHNVLIRTERKSQPTAKKKRKKSQKLVAAYIIAQNPDITGQELTVALKDAFPSANIDVNGGRHGPHYLSLSRTGKLPVAPDDDPREW